METLNHKFYYNSYLKYGISAKGVHWQSKKSQYIRFEVLTSFLEKIENHTLLDLGCGFAEYLNYLEINKITCKKYIGIDCEEFMIETAKKRYPNNRFLKANILEDDLEKVDYVICSGGYNLMNKVEFINAIENSFKIVKKGLIFNFLTKNNLHNLTIEEILKYSRNFTNKIDLNTNYLQNDATIYLKK
ncbi:class I SAM-dependent methyltransferase [Halarcobacter sp.]|uniref:class I SAM-dependent methyltransferase n=1 Tax=Halarcobacter sp. TaxID=2321133 RepID=UPI002AA95CCF|nr:class I SAM-dependent methyltransferase [Halarcobacter sp.]